MWFAKLCKKIVNIFKEPNIEIGLDYTKEGHDAKIRLFYLGAELQDNKPVQGLNYIS